MRNPLSKRIPRDLLKNFGKYLGMMLILVVTISVGSAFETTMNGAQEYLDAIEEGKIQEDGFFETNDKLTVEQLEAVEDENVKVYENFYASENDFPDSSKVIMFNERDEIDIPTIFDGRLPDAADEIALDHVFARSRQFDIGSTISLLGKEYEVVGTVSLPDYSSLFMNNTDLMMNTTHFCVAVLNQEGFDAIEDKNITYRYSYLLENKSIPDSEKVTKSEDMMKALVMSGANIQTFLRADQNQSISFLPMDMGKDGPMMKVFIYILIILIAFVFAIMTNNTIENEAVIIGTFRALGYSKGEIVWHYMQPTIIVALLGSVIGNVLGYTVMIQPFLNMYYTSYSIGPLPIRFDLPTFIITNVIPVILMILIIWVMLSNKLSLSPLKFLRKELKKGKIRKARKLPNVKFLSRFRMRVILQNKGSYIMLFIGIFLASFLLMFGIGLRPLMEHYTDTIDESLPYDYQYILKAPVEMEDAEPVLVYEMESWFELGGKDIGVSCFGIKENSELFRGALSDNGVTISSALSKKMKLSEGDTLALHDKNKDKDHEFMIAGVYDYSASLAMFIPQEELADILELDEDYYNCLLSDKELDIDESYLVKKITRNDMLGATDQMMDSFGTVIAAVNVFSVLIYMILMYILVKVVIDKNSLSISYMKVFGYTKKEISKLYLTPTAIVVIISLFICIPLEVLAFKGVLEVLSSMIEGYLEFYLPLWVYVEIVIVGIVAYFAINALHIHQINGIPMTDALKNRE